MISKQAYETEMNGSQTISNELTNTSTFESVSFTPHEWFGFFQGNRG